MPSPPAPSATSGSNATGYSGPTKGHETPARWTLRLLGGFELSDGEERHTRLASRPMVALLARLAMWPNRNHPREELVELLWPGVEPEVSRNRLRQALSALKAVLEPARAVSAPVLQADRFDVRLVPGAIHCDVVAFEQGARQGRIAAALACYRGEVLPGFFDEWLVDERERLEAVHDRLLAKAPVAQAQSQALAATADHAEPSTVDLHAAPPSLRAALPVYLTRHFMAPSARAAWVADLAGHRLVTLLGPGGCGKTRLAVELARALLSPAGAGPAGDAADSRVGADPPGRRGAAPTPEPCPEPIDAAAFVSLVSCSTRTQTIDALMAALGVPGRGGEPLDDLVAAMAERRLLLVLDNFEQLVDGAADVVARLAGALPRLRIIVTSRRALGIDGERELAVRPLDIPSLAMPLERAGTNPAVALFIDRARQARTDFHLNEGNCKALLGLARALEGLPLAIELAASRIRSLAPARMLELLAGPEVPTPRLELLARTGPRSGLDARHASMTRVIEWSWQQLPPHEARLMEAVTVFKGGFTAPAAAAVQGLAPMHAVLWLDALVANSMLRATEMPWGDVRFDMDEPIREYALLQSQPAAQAAGRCRAAHRSWLTGWAEGLPATPSLPAIRAEMPNIDAAMRSAVADGDPASAVRTALALHRAHNDLALGAGTLASLEGAVLRCDDAALRSLGHTRLAQWLFAAARGDDARRHAECGLELAPADPAPRAAALHMKARLHWLAIGHAAWMEAMLDEAQALARAANEVATLAGITVLRAAITYKQHRDMAGGEALYRAALELWEQLGNQHAINGGRYFVALVVHEAGRHPEAIERADEVVASARRLGDLRRVSQALQVRGKAQMALRRWPEAAATYGESIALAWDAMSPLELARSMRDLPPVLAHLRQFESAVQLQAFSARFWRDSTGQADAFDLRQERRVRRLVAGQLAPARWERERRRGIELSVADAVALALRDGAPGASAAALAPGAD